MKQLHLLIALVFAVSVAALFGDAKVIQDDDPYHLFSTNPNAPHYYHFDGDFYFASSAPPVAADASSISYSFFYLFCALFVSAVIIFRD